MPRKPKNLSYRRCLQDSASYEIFQIWLFFVNSSICSEVPYPKIVFEFGLKFVEEMFAFEDKPAL
jgi:hypothetical protein